MQFDLRRREFITLLGGAAAWPLAARAQQKVPLIGLLLVRGPEPMGPFREALRDLGYLEGKTIQIEKRSAEGHEDRLPELAAELVRGRIDVLVASLTPRGGSLAARGARAAAASDARRGLSEQRVVRRFHTPDGCVQTANLAGGVVRPHRNDPAHGKPPQFAILNHAAIDSGIPRESATQRLGIALRRSAQRRPGFTDRQPFPCSARLASNYPVRRTYRAAPAASSPAGALSLGSTLARRGSIYPPCRCIPWRPSSSRHASQAKPKSCRPAISVFTPSGSD